MAKKKKYKKKHYNGRTSNGFEVLLDLSGLFIQLIATLFIAAILANLFFKKQLIEFENKYFPTVKFYFFIVFGILFFVLVILLGILIYRKFFKKEEKIDNQELAEILNEIKTFKQFRKHSSEVEYHMEIAGFLKRTFPNLKIEQTSGNTRPDIVIENVAIEIKGPTSSSGLQTIADKIIRYLKHYEYIIVILFDIQVSEENFKEWKADIIENFSHKGDRVIIIDK